MKIIAQQIALHHISLLIWNACFMNVEDLKDFSKLQSGKSQLVFDYNNLISLVAIRLSQDSSSLL